MALVTTASSKMKAIAPASVLWWPCSLLTPRSNAPAGLPPPCHTGRLVCLQILWRRLIAVPSGMGQGRRALSGHKGEKYYSSHDHDQHKHHPKNPPIKCKPSPPPPPPEFGGGTPSGRPSFGRRGAWVGSNPASLDNAWLLASFLSDAVLIPT